MWSTAGYFSTCSAAVNLILSPSTSLPRYCNKGRVLKEAKDRDYHLQQRKESEHLRVYCTCQHRGCCSQGAHSALCPFSGLSLKLSAMSWITDWPIYSCTFSLLPSFKLRFLFIPPNGFYLCSYFSFSSPPSAISFYILPHSLWWPT